MNGGNNNHDHNNYRGDGDSDLIEPGFQHAEVLYNEYTNHHSINKELFHPDDPAI